QQQTNVFCPAPKFLEDPDMTEEQKQIIMKRIHEVRSKYEAFVEKDINQKIQTIMFASDLTEEKARLALSLCHDDEHEVLNKLAGKSARGFRNLLQPASYIPDEKYIEEGYSSPSTPSTPTAEEFESLDQIDVPFTLPSTRTTVIALGCYHKSPSWWSSPGSLYHHPIPINYKAKRIESNTTYIMSIEEDPTTGNPLFRVTNQSTKQSFTGSSPTKPWTMVCVSHSSSRATRISGPLFFGFSDPLLQQLFTKMVKENDIEEYYYRFVGEGEIFCCDKEWKDEERQILLSEIRKFCGNIDPLITDSDVSFHFGLVARNIPNRTGFQCQYEYNRLVTTGQIGEFDGCPVTALRVNYDKLVKSMSSNGQIKRARKFSSQKEDDKWNAKTKINYNPWNPLPNMKDAITMENMNEPAISPDGFTKKRLTRRQLVKLTFDNIADYLDRIREP
ncbi:3777_t:CDS:2, partial [Scutellospora calospora]